MDESKETKSCFFFVFCSQWHKLSMFENFIFLCLLSMLLLLFLLQISFGFFLLKIYGLTYACAIHPQCGFYTSTRHPLINLLDHFSIWIHLKKKKYNLKIANSNLVCVIEVDKCYDRLKATVEIQHDASPLCVLRIKSKWYKANIWW